VTEYADFAVRLRDVLEGTGMLEVDGGARSRPALLSPDGRRFVFAQTLAQMHAAVSRIDGEVLSSPADSSPLEGQLRLFSVHVWEALEAAAGDAGTLRITASGVAAE
jgi:acyl transferase domain-containing protein